MTLGWMDTSQLSFNHLLLLEKVQISWMAGVPEREMAIALQANPVVAWYLRHKCPELSTWVEILESMPFGSLSEEQVYTAEQRVMQSINDWLVYVIDPQIYDRQPFLNWDSDELTTLADFSGKVVADVGAGTGRLTMTVAPLAQHVFAIEPVENLRGYLKEKARQAGLQNIFVLDGLATDVPFPDCHFDITMGGHVFGDAPLAEIRELERVTCPGGKIILCPGNPDVDNDAHQILIGRDYHFARFEEPGSGLVRKYWKTIS